MSIDPDSVERWSSELREGDQQLRLAHSHRRQEPGEFVRRFEAFSGTLVDFEKFDRWKDEASLATIRQYVNQIESDYRTLKRRIENRELRDRINAPRPWQGGRADGNR